MEQRVCAGALDEALKTPKNSKLIMACIQDLAFSLFSYVQKDPDQDKYFSAIN